MKTVPLGDMAVLGDVGAPPAKMWKALAVIAAHLHRSYDDVSGFAPGASKDKCLFASLAVRDFLVGIGFADATVRGCALFVYADDKQGKQLWSVGCGVPGERDIVGKFNGHAVVTVPSIKFMIDTTLYQAQRPQFVDLPGMAALPYYEPQHGGIRALYGLPIFAHVIAEHADRDVGVAWLDRPDLPWKKSEDFRFKNARRISVTKALCDAFGEFTEGDQT